MTLTTPGVIAGLPATTGVIAGSDFCSGYTTVRGVTAAVSAGDGTQDEPMPRLISADKTIAGISHVPFWKMLRVGVIKPRSLK
jgi:hypothetical protein